MPFSSHGLFIIRIKALFLCQPHVTDLPTIKEELPHWATCSSKDKQLSFYLTRFITFRCVLLLDFWHLSVKYMRFLAKAYIHTL